MNFRSLLNELMPPRRRMHSPQRIYKYQRVTTCFCLLPTNLPAIEATMPKSEIRTLRRQLNDLRRKHPGDICLAIRVGTIRRNLKLLEKAEGGPELQEYAPRTSPASPSS